MQHFYTKLLYQKPMLRQIEWGVQNGPITKVGVLQARTSFVRKFCFSLRTSYKELIWCINHANVHIHRFRKLWSFIWGCFFRVSILNYYYQGYCWHLNLLRFNISFYRYQTCRKSKFLEQKTWRNELALKNKKVQVYPGKRLC